jgi:CBS domain-containing protein
MSLENFCRRSVIKISLHKSAAQACQMMMKENNIGCLIAEEDGKLCGIVADRDIALKVAGALRNPEKTLVMDIMTPAQSAFPWTKICAS